MTEPPTWSSPGGDAPPPAPVAPPGWGGSPPPPAAPGGWDGAPTGAPGSWGGAPTGWGGPPPLAPRPGIIPLRPLGLGELLDGAVGIVRRYPRPTLGLSAVVAAVTTVLNVGLVLLLLDDLTATSGSADLGDAEVGGAVVLGVASTVIGALAAVVLTGIITAVVGKAVLGAPMTTGQAWSEVRPRIWSLVGLSLLTGLIFVAPIVVGVVAAVVLVAVGGEATLLLGVPLGVAGVVAAVYVYVRLALAPAALVLERAGVRASLRRSGELVARSWWRAFGVLALTIVITAVVTGLLQVPFFILGAFFGEATTQVLAQVGGGVATAIVAPFSAGVTALLYVDRRIRAEGLDVSLAAAAASPGA